MIGSREIAKTFGMTPTHVTRLIKKSGVPHTSKIVVRPKGCSPSCISTTYISKADYERVFLSPEPYVNPKPKKSSKPDPRLEVIAASLKAALGIVIFGDWFTPKKH